VRRRAATESARKENVLSDTENKDTTEDERVNLKNDEGDSADVEGHRFLTKNMPKTEDGEDDGTPDVEAHKVMPRNHL
jgi:hypothetical protein